MGHLIRWESLFFFQIPHKSSMGHLFRCGFFYLFFSHQFSHKSSMGRLFRCGSSVLLFWISLKSSMGRLSRCGSSILLFWISLKSSMGRLFRCESSILLLSYKPSIGSLVLFSICTCMYVCKRFAQGTCSPYHSTSVRG